MKYEVIVYTSTYDVINDGYFTYETAGEIDEQSYGFENLVEIRDWLYDEGFWYPSSSPDVFASTWLSDEREQDPYTGRMTDRSVHVVNGSAREWIAVVYSLLEKVKR